MDRQGQRIFKILLSCSAHPTEATDNKKNIARLRVSDYYPGYQTALLAAPLICFLSFAERLQIPVYIAQQGYLTFYFNIFYERLPLEKWPGEVHAGIFQMKHIYLC